jgi:D-alanyl-D-alanine dipeptidase
VTRPARRLTAALTIVAALACAGRQGIPAGRNVPAMPNVVASARQLVVVTTPSWNATAGTLRRYERATAASAWQVVGTEDPVVVGRAGLAWDPTLHAAMIGGPEKREGDGRAPAGAFPLDTAFGFATAPNATAIRLPYVPLQPGSDCVDDVASAHYNTVVDRAAVARVDWTSAEHMRSIDQYRLGVIVGYNAAPPMAGRGSCIFLHIWAGPTSTTAGCTAMDAAVLGGLLHWLTPDARPALVQLTTDGYARLRGAWRLP